jgi:transcriptional regulator with XRE-family HTH domain
MDVRSARLVRAVSLDALAARTGLSVQTCWRIERGLCTPSLRSRRLVAEALGVAPAEIEWPGLALGPFTSRGALLTKSVGEGSANGLSTS